MPEIKLSGLKIHLQFRGGVVVKICKHGFLLKLLPDWVKLPVLP